MVKTKDILELLNNIAPFDIAEDWDNSGLQVGNLNWEVQKVMIGLDVSMSLMMAAKQGNCDLVLTHHPLMIQPEKSINFNRMPGRAIEIAAKNNISIVSAHTNLDKARDGLNDYFATKIGLETTKVFFRDGPLPVTTDEMIGLGRIGYLESPTPLNKLVLQIKEKLNLNHLRVTGDMNLPVTCVAICTGSGGSLVDEFLKSRAEVYITGDIKYHEARQVEERSKGLIDVGHFGSEHMAIDLMFDKLGKAIQKAGLNIGIEKFKKERDPFIIV
jgi:dinuclear metal center YbgI/SA1388 family protein